MLHIHENGLFPFFPARVFKDTGSASTDVLQELQSQMTVRADSIRRSCINKYPTLQSDYESLLSKTGRSWTSDR